MKVKAGSSNISVPFYVVGNASSATPGEPVTGLLFSDIETGGSASYIRQGAASVDLTLITLASASAAHADGGFILVEDTKNPGVYRCDFPDAAFVTGVDQVILSIVIASGKNAVASPILVDIDDNVDQTGDAFARIGVNGAGLSNLTFPGTISSLDGLDTAQDLEHAITQGLVNSLAAAPGSGSIPYVPTTITVTSGTGASGSANDMANDDEDVYTVDDAAGTLTLDLDYQFDAGISGIEFTLVAAVQGVSDDLTVQFYDQVGLGYDTIDTIVGANGLTYETFDKTVVNKYTTNTGLMQVRITGTGLASATLTINKAVVNAVSAAGGIPNGSTITLAAAQNNQNFIGHNWILALGGQDIGGSYFAGAKEISGTGICANGDQYKIEDSQLLVPSLTSYGLIKECGTTGITFTSSALGVADKVMLRNIYSSVPGAGSPTYTWAAVTKETSISVRGCHGGAAWIFTSDCTASIELYDGGGHSITTGGGDVEFRGDARSLDIILTGGETVQVRASLGPITISGIGTGSTVNIYGENAGVTNTASGSPTVTNGSINTSVINGTAGVLLDPTATSAQLISDNWDEILTGATHNISNSAGRRLRDLASMIIRGDTAQGAGTGNNQIQLDVSASAVDGAYDPALVSIVSGAGMGQTRQILQYDGATKTATVDRNWKVNPDGSSDYVIIGDAGREHVNEGLAQAGTTSSITLNSLASSSDNTYIGQVVFIRSGTGDDQARTVVGYNGTTKIATVGVDWNITPDVTSGYTMLPLQVFTLQQIIDNTGFATEAKQDIIDSNLDTVLGQTGTTGVKLEGTPDVNITQLGGSTTSLTNLVASTSAIVVSSVNDGSATSTVFIINSTETVDDTFVGSLLVFTSTASIANQRATVTAYNGTTKQITVSAGLTTAPADTDSFVMV